MKKLVNVIYWWMQLSRMLCTFFFCQWWHVPHWCVHCCNVWGGEGQGGGRSGHLPDHQGHEEEETSHGLQQGRTLTYLHRNVAHLCCVSSLVASVPFLLSSHPPRCKVKFSHGTYVHPVLMFDYNTEQSYATIAATLYNKRLMSHLHALLMCCGLHTRHHLGNSISMLYTYTHMIIYTCYTHAHTHTHAVTHNAYSQATTYAHNNIHWLTESACIIYIIVILQWLNLLLCISLTAI